MKKELQQLEEGLKNYFDSDKFKKSVAEHSRSAPETLSALSEIKEEMHVGFNGVNTRIDEVHVKQDYTNGKVNKNTNWRLMITGALIFTNILLIPMAFILFSKILDRIV